MVGANKEKVRNAEGKRSLAPAARQVRRQRSPEPGIHVIGIFRKIYSPFW
jgi:hypothetical protein